MKAPWTTTCESYSKRLKVECSVSNQAKQREKGGLATKPLHTAKFNSQRNGSAKLLVCRPSGHQVKFLTLHYVCGAPNSFLSPFPDDHADELR